MGCEEVSPSVVEMAADISGESQNRSFPGYLWGCHSFRMQQKQTRLRRLIGRLLTDSLIQVCGGTFLTEVERTQLRENAISSISFPNKRNDSVGGKPHDIEVRIALTEFHRWKRMGSSGEVTIKSDLGLTRRIRTPRDLAELLVLPLEASCQKEGVAHDIRLQPSGIISIVSIERSLLLRKSGKLPCPHCVKWCQGEKGLWWHQQQNHSIEHSEATAVAASSADQLAIMPYNPALDSLNSDFAEVGKQILSTPTNNEDDPLELIKEGDLDRVKRAVERGYTPSREIDRRGASPLMWAAGSGHLSVCRFLVEECDCDPNQPQRGKRSFSGRTALHWAARNGHLSVVDYLVRDCGVDVESSTVDGTTAFGWACWQGHLPIMEFLSNRHCDIHRVNSFGCNAVLWCAQGKGDIATMEWLQSRRCDMTKVNSNGHGALHKAAQRGQWDVCLWFFNRFVTAAANIQDALRLVGPDKEGYCPSDLAGMEGNIKLAKRLATEEMAILQGSIVDPLLLPGWLTEAVEGISMRVTDNDLYTWEPLGGVRRMRSRLLVDPSLRQLA